MLRKLSGLPRQAASSHPIDRDKRENGSSVSFRVIYRSTIEGKKTKKKKKKKKREKKTLASKEGGVRKKGRTFSVLERELAFESRKVGDFANAK